MTLQRKHTEQTSVELLRRCDKSFPLPPMSEHRNVNHSFEAELCPYILVSRRKISSHRIFQPPQIVN